jgi:acyl-CoA dehydrogenase
MMEQLSYERLTVGLGAVATAEQALAITTNYVKERMAVGTRDRPPLDQVVAMQP